MNLIWILTLGLLFQKLSACSVRDGPAAKRDIIFDSVDVCVLFKCA